VEAFFAGATGVVVDDGLDDDAVARLEVAYVLPDLFNGSAEFMPKCKGDGFSGYGVGSCWTEVGAA
jgi:hypothetical protein